MISIASTRPPAVDGISSWSNVLSRTMCPSHETHANDGAAADWDDDHDGVGDDDDDGSHDDGDDNDVDDDGAEYQNFNCDIVMIISTEGVQRSLMMVMTRMMNMMIMTTTSTCMFALSALL